MRWSDWLYERLGRTHAISLNHLAEALFEYLIARGVEKEMVAEAMANDLARGRRGDVPEFLKPFVTAPSGARHEAKSTLRRQARHLA
jgi:hypothetical protein